MAAGISLASILSRAEASRGLTPPAGIDGAVGAGAAVNSGAAGATAGAVVDFFEVKRSKNPILRGKRPAPRWRTRFPPAFDAQRRVKPRSTQRAAQPQLARGEQAEANELSPRITRINTDKCRDWIVLIRVDEASGFVAKTRGWKPRPLNDPDRRKAEISTMDFADRHGFKTTGSF